MKKLRYLVLGVVALLMIGCSSNNEQVSESTGEDEIVQNEVADYEEDDDNSTELDTETEQGGESQQDDSDISQSDAQTEELIESASPELTTQTSSQTQEPPVAISPASTPEPAVTPTTTPAPEAKPASTPAAKPAPTPELAAATTTTPTPEPADTTEEPATTQAPADAPQTSEPTPEPAPVEDKISVAASHIGGGVNGLLEAIGQPSSRNYAPSCNGPGDDGILEYNGFTVYTYRENGVERIDSVE